MSEPDYFYYDPAEWRGEQPDWEIEDQYSEYDVDDNWLEDEYEGYAEDFYTDDDGLWVYDADDEDWPYSDEDDESETL